MDPIIIKTKSELHFIPLNNIKDASISITRPSKRIEGGIVYNYTKIIITKDGITHT